LPQKTFPIFVWLQGCLQNFPVTLPLRPALPLANPAFSWTPPPNSGQHFCLLIPRRTRILLTGLTLDVKKKVGIFVPSTIKLSLLFCPTRKFPHPPFDATHLLHTFSAFFFLGLGALPGPALFFNPPLPDPLLSPLTYPTALAFIVSNFWVGFTLPLAHPSWC